MADLTPLDWLLGNLTPAERVWTALAPAILAFAYFAGALVLFSVRSVFRGVEKDAETLKRGASGLVGFYLRHSFFWAIRPLWTAVYRSGIPANAVTALAALISIASGVAVASGRFALGGWLFLFAGILDVVDGRLARARNSASPAGAALDSVLDRYADSAILIGLGWYYRDSWVLLPVLLALLGTSLVPYVRARGEGLGVAIRSGWMQRLERVLFLGGGVALAPILEALAFPERERPMHWVAIAGIAIVAAGSNITAITRLRELLRALAPKRRAVRPSLARVASLHVAAAALATAVDFALVLALVEHGEVVAPAATAVGALLGAAVNYGFNRWITFRSDASAGPQVARYALVSATSAMLNAGGMAVLTLHPGVPYALAWWLVRGAVYLAWNLPLHREYVFGTPPAGDGVRA